MKSSGFALALAATYCIGGALTFAPAVAAVQPAPFRDTTAQRGTAAGAPITLRGTVLDTSVTPHRPVAEAVVTVLVQSRHGSVHILRAARTDARGAFALALPTLPAGGALVLRATYRGVSYDTPLAPANLGRPQRLSVYDTTASDAGLVAMSVTVGARRHGQGLSVIEEWVFANAGSTTVVGASAASGRDAARFALPPGASHVAIRGVGPQPAGAEVRRGAVVVDAVLRPATGLNAASFHQVTFTFDLASEAAHPTLLIPTNYFIGSLKVFTLKARLVAPGFKRTTLATGNTTIPAYEIQAVQPGTTLAVGVDGSPAAVATTPVAVATPPGFPVASVAAMAGLGFGALLLLGLFGRAAGGATNAPHGAEPNAAARRDGPEGAARVAEPEVLRQERARLVEAVAALDLAHAAGTVAEARYRRERAATLGRLRGIAQQLGE